MLRTVGNFFPKRWQVCDPNLSEYILNKHKCQKKTLQSETLHATMEETPWNS